MLDTSPIVNCRYKNKNGELITFEGFYNSESGDYLHWIKERGVMYTCSKRELKKICSNIELLMLVSMVPFLA